MVFYFLFLITRKQWKWNIGWQLTDPLTYWLHVSTQKVEKGLFLDSQTRGIVMEGSCFNTTLVYIPPERCPAITCNACSTSMNTAVSYQQQLLQKKPRDREGMSISTFCNSPCELFTGTGVQVGLPLQQCWFHSCTETAEESRAEHTKCWSLLSVWGNFLLPLLFCTGNVVYNFNMGWGECLY